MTKSVLLLCVVVLLAAGGVTWGLTKVSAEVHRTSIALDTLSSRVSATEQDLGSIADEMGELADAVNAIADSLAEDDEDTEEGEAVSTRPPPARSPRTHARKVRARAYDAAARHTARREGHRDHISSGATLAAR